MTPSPTLETWRDPALLRDSFARIEEFLPTARISRGPGPVAPLVPAPADLRALRLPAGRGTVGDVLATTETDAWLVLHEGRVVAEEYVAPTAAATRHLLMSVSKSIVGVVAGALEDRGQLDAGRPVTSYVPELVGTGYDGTSVRDVLDMRSGVRFSEDYLDPDAEVSLLDEAAGWAPRRPAGPTSLKEFLRGLTHDGPHSGAFRYRSCETDVLGWVIEAATGRPFADVAGDLLWSRIGAETDAAITLDAADTGMFDGGMCATLRDLARFGALMLGGGVALTGERVLPQPWVADVFAGSPELRAAFAAGPHAGLLPGGHYRSQFWVPAGGDVVLCVGIHGQLVYVDRAAGLVGVKLSSWPLPTDDDRMGATLAMFEAIATSASRSRTRSTPVRGST